MPKALLIMGIETSCDETSAAVLADGTNILSNVISSQIPVHQKYGGVVPEIASRKHVELISSVIQEALDEASITFGDLDAVAVTYGPGLVGALLVGVSAAKALAYTLDIPLVGVNHIQGHIYANFLAGQPPEFPLICLVVSGGHTEIILFQSHEEFRTLGHTRDDAAGEAFDKMARALGLGYPGGPRMEKLAVEGNPEAISFPRAYLENDSLDFSFSGLKSHGLNYLNRISMKGEVIPKADMAAGFQKAIVDVLVDKAVDAALRYKVGTIMLAGGVAANSKLRQELESKAGSCGISVRYPAPVLCTDNAAMVACAGYYKMIRGELAPLSLNAVPNLKLGCDKY